MKDNLTIKNKIELEKINFFDKAVFIELPIHTEDISVPFNDIYQNKKSKEVLDNLANTLINKTTIQSLIFVYGSPLQLMKFHESVKGRLYFHYWIALDIGFPIERNYHGLSHNHLGILVYSKNNSLAALDVKNTRFPHISCLACENNIKDWGGKKHLMNSSGTGLSDVWKDLYKTISKKQDSVIPQITLNKLDTKNSFFSKNLTCPDEVINRIKRLTNKLGLFKISIDKEYLGKLNTNKKFTEKNIPKETYTKLDNKILLGDCIKEMEKLSKVYPNGLFDLVFADPPYNLSKNYKEYDDEKSSLEYENWCNRWIELSIKLTKPGGSIFVLNIPKWALSHAKILNRDAFFRNWIVWDALSTPKGKIMPAHYSLLHYTKGSAYPTFNSLDKIDAIPYCLRNSCKKMRGSNPEHLINRVDISEIWSDVHRIKHKKDRDDHPCQLPHRLMDRIIQMFSSRDSLIFDPFGGAGTTGICAVKNNRKFLLTELDPYYKKISEERIAETVSTGDTIRKKISKKIKSKYTKKFLETKVQELSSALKRKPTLDEFAKKFQIDITEVKKLYPDPRTVLKAGRIGLMNQQF